MRVALAEAKFMQKSLAKEYLPLENLAKELDLRKSLGPTLEEDLERKWATSLGKDLRQDVLAIRKVRPISGRTSRPHRPRSTKSRLRWTPSRSGSRNGSPPSRPSCP